MYFLGVQRYDKKHRNKVMPASITADVFTYKDLSTSGGTEKYFQKYSAITMAEIRNTTSQIRRFQKRVNVTGFMMPPTTSNTLSIL